ncbi:hypothetical protein LCGC14_0376560 [marine sediment metagenome]|uniref:Uncharacterized protein n=1 Tax=marine sediment metagenome TaxID=412755 RepID=A0A0F9T3F6_9ZZZZ
MSEKLEVTNCSSCGDEFDEEERENPRRDSSDDPICDDCYREYYEFTCCKCEEYGDQKDQHNLLVVLEAEIVRIESEDDYLKPGIYQVVDTPYWATDYFESWIRWKAVTWLCENPFDIAYECYPCGHLCLTCQNELWERIGARPVTFEKIEEPT